MGVLLMFNVEYFTIAILSNMFNSQVLEMLHMRKRTYDERRCLFSVFH